MTAARQDQLASLQASGIRIESVAATGREPVRLRSPDPRTVLAAAIVLVVVATLFAALGAIGPYMVGFVYIVAAYPFVQAFAARGLPRWAAVIAVFALTIVILGVFALFVVGFLSQTSTFASSLHSWVTQIVDGLLGQLVATGTTRPDQVARFYDATQELAARITSGVLGVLAPAGSGPLGAAGSLFAFGTVPFWAYYLMKDWPKLSDAIDRRLPAAWAPEVRAAMSIVGRSFSTWIRGQLVASGVAGAFTFIEFEILGVLINPVFRDVAFVMAAIAFAFELVPSVGPTIALIPYLLVGAAAGTAGVAAVFVGWVIAQQVENAWIVPRVQSRATDLHPAVILSVLVIGGAIHGLLGVILAVPVASALWRIATRYLPGDKADPDGGPRALARPESTGLEIAPGRVVATEGDAA